MNKYQPNLQILCEDKINRDIANGFILGLHNNDVMNFPRIESYPELAGGWTKAVHNLINFWIENLRDNSNLFLLILIDSDGDTDRINQIISKIPEDLKERIFVMGCLNKPETLKQQSHAAIKEMDKKAKVSNENVGKVLFQHCKENPKDNLWYSDELKHNLAEIKRLKENINFITWS